MRNLLVFSLLFLAAISLSCKGPKSKNRRKKMEKAPSLVGVIRVKPLLFTPVVNTVGYAKPFKEVTLSVERPGKLVQLTGEVGEFLPARRLVARVRSLGLWSQASGAKARINEIRTALSQAQKDFPKSRGCGKKGWSLRTNTRWQSCSSRPARPSSRVPRQGSPRCRRISMEPRSLPSSLVR